MPALNTGVNGQVMNSVDIDATGVVSNVTILEEQPTKVGFAETAVDAAQDTLYFPACRDGMPMAESGRIERLNHSMNP